MTTRNSDIHFGRALAPGEQILWEGSPSFGALAIGVFHVRPIVSYFVLISAVAQARALGHHVPYVAAIMPQVTGAGLLCAASYGVARSTKYIITTNRVILRFGLALPRTLSIPFKQIASMAVSVGADQRGDIALVLRGGNRMPYLKLWPHARPWHLRRPQPMLRSCEAAGTVASLLARSLSQHEHAQMAGLSGTIAQEDIGPLAA